jgi:hypothetical protein
MGWWLTAGGWWLTNYKLNVFDVHFAILAFCASF